jgi:hypothetical protein
MHISLEQRNTPNFDITVLNWLPDEPGLVKYSASLPVPVSARLLRLWVGIPPAAWMSVSCELLIRGLCDGLITRPEEYYRL